MQRTYLKFHWVSQAEKMATSGYSVNKALILSRQDTKCKLKQRRRSRIQVEMRMVADSADAELKCGQLMEPKSQTKAKDVLVESFKQCTSCQRTNTLQDQTREPNMQRVWWTNWNHRASAIAMWKSKGSMKDITDTMGWNLAPNRLFEELVVWNNWSSTEQRNKWSCSSNNEHSLANLKSKKWEGIRRQEVGTTSYYAKSSARLERVWRDSKYRRETEH